MKKLAKITNKISILKYHGPCDGLDITQDVFNILKRSGAKIEWYNLNEHNVPVIEKTAQEKTVITKKIRNDFRKEVLQGDQYIPEKDINDKVTIVDEIDVMPEFKKLEKVIQEEDDYDLRIKNKLDDIYYEDAFTEDVSVVIDDSGNIEEYKPNYDLSNKITFFSDEDLASKEVTRQMLIDELKSRGFTTVGHPHFPKARDDKQKLINSIKATQAANAETEFKSFINSDEII